MNKNVSYPKGSVIIDQNEESAEGLFVISGMVCSLFEHEESIEVFEFYTEGMPVLFPINEADTMKGCKLICITDVVIAKSNISRANEAMIKFPSFEKVCRLYAEKSIKSNLDFIHQLRQLSPLDRYSNFIKRRPKVHQNAPQYLIASYLGISPESLSRIRKRLATN